MRIQEAVEFLNFISRRYTEISGQPLPQLRSMSTMGFNGWNFALARLGSDGCHAWELDIWIGDDDEPELKGEGYLARKRKIPGGQTIHIDRETRAGETTDWNAMIRFIVEPPP